MDTLSKFSQTYLATATAPFVGDRVESLDNGAYKGFGTVTKVNPKTIAVLLDNGKPVKFPYSLLVPAGADAPTAPTAADVENVFHTLPIGTVVRFTPKPGQTALYAVIKHGTTPGTVNLAKVGGDNNRYYRAVPATKVTRVNVQEV